MTTKTKRQRGSRTHGGGSHKKRRGAGHRGGRGRAGRTKHEKNNYPPRKKHGFNRPKKVQTTIETVQLREIDEDIPLLLETEAAEETEYGYWVDARKLADDPEDADTIKLLGGGQIHNRINVVVDDCTAPAKEKIKSMGGKVYFSGEKALEAANKVETAISKRYFTKSNKNDNHNNSIGRRKLEEYLEKVESGTPLEFHEFDNTVRIGDSSNHTDLAYEVLSQHAPLLEDLSGLDAINMMQGRDFSEKYDYDAAPFKRQLGGYFEGFDASAERIEVTKIGLPDDIDVEGVLSGIDYLHETYDEGLYEGEEDIRDEQIGRQVRLYLLAVDEMIDWI